MLYAQSDDWKFSGQLQIRSELDGRDFSNTTYPLTFTSMRTRFGVERKLFDNASAFVQIQDSRVWGEEKNTLGSIKNIDLHQAFVKFGNIFDSPLAVQAGRFEYHKRNGRIFASNQFNYISRSWDGALISYQTKPFGIELFGYTHNSSVPYIGSAIPDTTQYPYPSKPETGYNVWGMWSNFVFAKEHYLDVFAYLDQNRAKTTKGNPTTDRYTAGIYYKVSISDFFAVIEGAYQGGTAGDMKSTTDPKDVQAYTGAISLNYKISDLTFGLNFDMLSGTSKDDQTKGEVNNTYDATFQGKHSFYGGMDYFSNITKGTGNYGLNDAFLKIDYSPKEAKLSGSLALHYFMTNQPYTLQNNEENSALGQEVDFILNYKLPLKGSSLEWGASVFLPGDVQKDIFDLNKTDGASEYNDRTDPAFWTYLMLRVAL